MCIIIANKKTPITRQRFDICWENNPDGFGLMYSDGKRLHVYRELTDDERAYRKYLEARAKAHGTVVLHFRIATSGEVDLSNCHPFFVNEKLAVCHNGMIPINHKPTESDTRSYIRKTLKNLPPNFLRDKAIRTLIALSIDHSKLAFLDNFGACDIVNKHLGVQDGDDWYSNTSYRWEKFQYPATSKAYGDDYATELYQKYGTAYRATPEKRHGKEYFDHNWNAPDPCDEQECEICGEPEAYAYEGLYCCMDCYATLTADRRTPAPDLMDIRRERAELAQAERTNNQKETVR